MTTAVDPKLEVRENYRHCLMIPTRLSDIDVYQHVNNVQYYAYFDTLVNDWLTSGECPSDARRRCLQHVPR